jgi:hypothetical protein
VNKREVELGSRFGLLTVIGKAGTDKRGNQLVRVRCDCPDHTEKVVRLAALTCKTYVGKDGKTRKPLRSCGCASKAAYREYWEMRAAGLGKRAQRALWESHQKGETFKEIALRSNLPPGVVAAACRLYNQGNPKPICGAIPHNTKAYWEYFE